MKFGGGAHATFLVTHHKTNYGVGNFKVYEVDMGRMEIF